MFMTSVTNRNLFGNTCNGSWVGGVVDLGCVLIYIHMFFYLHVLVDPKLCLTNINLNPIPIGAALRCPTLPASPPANSSTPQNRGSRLRLPHNSEPGLIPQLLRTALPPEASLQFRAKANSSTPENGAPA